METQKKKIRMNSTATVAGDEQYCYSREQYRWIVPPWTVRFFFAFDDSTQGYDFIWKKFNGN